MRPRHLLSALTCIAVLGCGADTDKIRSVAEAFWEASRNGDTELAMSYVSSSSMARINKSDDDTSVKSFTLGEVEVDGSEAAVRTSLSQVSDEDQMDVAFEKHGPRERGVEGRSGQDDGLYDGGGARRIHGCHDRGDG